MKLFLFLIGLLVAGFLGYSFEPQLREQLTGNKSGTERIESEQETEQEAEVVAADDVASEEEPEEPAEVAVESSGEVDPAALDADELPEKVLLKADVEISDESSDLNMTVTAGNRVNLIRVEGDYAIISPGAGPFEGSVLISDTDLLEQLGAHSEGSGDVVTEMDADALPTELDLEEEMTEPEVSEEEPLVEEEPAIEPEVVEAEEVIEDEPEVVQADPEPGSAAPQSIVEIMKDDIKKGSIKEFGYDQVIDWTANEDTETIDGEVFQTGIASYKAETVFGVKTITAKALIQDGHVVRWLWPKSGMEIK